MDFFEPTAGPVFRYPWFTWPMIIPLGLLVLYVPGVAGSGLHRWLNRWVLRREISLDGGKTWSQA